MLSTRKQAYYEGRGIHPDLAKLYYDRIGDVDRVLDLGCGTGDVGKHFDQRGIEVVGVDVDAGALTVAAEYESAVQADVSATDLPFPDAAFDGIVAKDILEHLNHPGPVVRELRRVLESGGRIIISVPMAKPHVVWGDYTHVRGFTRNALETMMLDSGFEVESVTPMGGVPGAGRFGLVEHLPTLLRLPVLRRFASSHELVARK